MTPLPIAFPPNDDQHAVAMYHAGIEVGREMAKEHALAEAVKQLADAVNKAIALYLAGKEAPR